MKKIILISSFLLGIYFPGFAQTVTDIDGNVYQTVTIGTQIWMAENLRVTHFQNGDSLKNIMDPVEWAYDIDGFCYYDNDETLGEVYGRIYNVYAATDARNICPSGWHVPSDANWEELFTFLGGDHVAGGKLKETGTEHWNSPNTGATNESGFNALPGGGRWLEGDVYDWGVFGGIHETAAFWSTDFPTPVLLKYNNDSITHTMNNTYGSAIRCVFIGTAGQGEINPGQGIRVDPNPTDGIIWVTGNQIKEIRIYNQTGSMIYTGNSKSIDIYGQPDGIYQLIITTASGEKATIKVIKQ